MNARRIVVRVVLLLAAVTLIASLVVVSSRQTVAAERKAVNGVSYGYELESYRFRNRIYLHLWNSAGMSLVFDLPGYYHVQMEEARWLAGDGVIYLRGFVFHSEDNAKNGIMKLLYDFRTSELVLSSPSPLWRISAETNPPVWISDTEFEVALAAKSSGR